VLRRFYTVMIVPHEGGALKRLSVSLNFVVSLAGVFVFCFVSSAFLAHFFLDGLYRPDPSEQARIQVDRLGIENARIRSELQQLVLTMEDLTSRLEEYAQLQADWNPPVEAMGGGGESASDSGLDGDWRVIARAAQDKAAFWTTTIEEQICDRSAELRALPSIWPVRGRVTSGYAMRRDPFDGTREFHAGVDIAAPHGTEVVCPGDGSVVEAGRSGGYVLGEVGSTGRSTGPHLHYEVLEGGRSVNPRGTYLR
jgi:murein DD-endopeptidase MepM/ murein hydrolase activator NlpD